MRYRRRSEKVSGKAAEEEAPREGIRAGSFRVRVDEDLCQGHGVCVDEAPEIFEMDPATNKVSLKMNEVERGLRERAELAVRHCPARALRIED
ncbi:MAG: ferredoxin [Myxococcota bacterium]|nr:ferredoxin [Myxococcota bacterium]